MFWKTWKSRTIFSLILSISMVATLFAFAPRTPVLAQTTVVSPEILADGSVIFRYYNPDASSVELYIENSKNDLGFWCYASTGWPILQMTLDETSGIWSVTLPPMEPEVYNYHFNVMVPPATGFTSIADPSNPTWHPLGINSQLYIPGPSADWESVLDVPHGHLQEVFYFSTATNSDRPLAVYTPPGYEEDNRKYPTLYLSHGGGGNHIDWTTQGVANNILDNLIAQHKIRPMVVVMTNFNGLSYPNGFRLDLINDVVPAVEDMFRVNRNPDQRAFAGLSLGGGLAANILVSSPTEFGFVGIWSGFGLNQANLQPNLDAIREMRAIDMSVGARDFLYPAMVTGMEALDYYEIPYTGLVTEGDCHTWFFWRQALYEFLTGPLFKVN